MGFVVKEKFGETEENTTEVITEKTRGKLVGCVQIFVGNMKLLEIFE